MKPIRLLYQTLKTTLQIGLLVCALIVAGAFIGSKTGLIPAITPFIVLSGSMEPRINTGSVVIVWPQTTYTIGDIITYSGTASDQFTTHRIMQVYNTNGQITYQTMGDANQNPDAAPVSKSQVKGKVMAHLPYAGYAASQAKEPKGFILLVIIPATIVVYEELRALLRELKRALFGKKKKRSKSPARVSSTGPTSNLESPIAIQSSINDQITRASNISPLTFDNSSSPLALTSSDSSPSPCESYAQTRGITAPLPPQNHPLMALFQTLPQASLTVSITHKTPNPASPAFPAKQVIKPKAPVSAFKLIPIISAVAVFVGVSGSYFLDQEISFDNLFAAGTWSTPDTTTLVINEVLPESTCTIGRQYTGWVELYNPTQENINLKDYRLSDGSTTVAIIHAGNHTIPPGQFALLAHDQAIWQQCWQVSATSTVKLGGQLNFNTGLLYLIDPEGTIIDALEWGSDPLSPPTDHSIERIQPGHDTAYGSEFEHADFLVQPIPSPGE